MKLAKFVLPFLCLATINAHSQTFSGNEFLQKLSDQDPEALLYLIGIVDAAEASILVFETDFIATTENTKKEAKATLGKYWGCRPKKASYGQVSDVTIAWLKNHPQVRHHPSSALIAAAMREAWPCN